MSSRKSRIEGDGLLKLVYRFAQKSRLTVGAAKNDMQLRTVAKLSEHAFVDFLRRRKLMLLEICKSQGVGNIIIIGCYSQRGLQLRPGPIKIAEHEITLAEHVVRADALGIGA